MSSSTHSSTIFTHGGAVFSGSLSAQRDINISHITTIRPLAHDLHHSLFTTSSSLFDQVQSELAVLLVALDTMKENLDAAGENASTALFSDIDEKLQNCHWVLLDLRGFKDSFDNMRPQTQVTWERMDWRKDELAEIRARLASYVGVLNLCNLNMIQTSQMHVERMLKAFIAEVRDGNRERSVLSNPDSLSMNGREAWRELRRELQSAGISHDMFIRNRRFIVRTLERALVDEDLGEFSLDVRDLNSDDDEMNGGELVDAGTTAAAAAAAAAAADARAPPTGSKASLGLTAWVPSSNRIAKLFSKATSSETPPLEDHLETSSNPPISTGLQGHAKAGNLDLIRECLEKGEDPNAKNADQETALTLAAAAGHAEAVQLLIDHGAEVNRMDPEHEKSAAALHKAAEKGQKEAVLVLLANGANIEIRDFWGDKPLHKAAQNGHAVVTQVLLKKGAKIDVRAIGRARKDAFTILSDWDN